MKFLKTGEISENEDLGEKELEVFQFIFKLVVGIVIYYRVYPDSIKPGLPRMSKKGEKCHYEKDLTNGLVNVTLKDKHGAVSKTVKKNISLHYRKGHFRTLWDNRYTRDEFGRPRVVHVKDCLVGKPQANPHTQEKVS